MAVHVGDVVFLKDGKWSWDGCMGEPRRVNLALFKAGLPLAPGVTVINFAEPGVLLKPEDVNWEPCEPLPRVFDIRGANEGRCQACQARIWWVKMPSGKAMPVQDNGISHFAECPEAKRFRKGKGGTRGGSEG